MTDYQSPEIDKLAEALAAAQGKIQHAAKAVSNDYFKSKYADLPAVIDAARPFLSEQGLAVAQVTTEGEAGLTLVTTLMHKSGQWLRGYYPIRPVKGDPQSLGSATTYGRRYSYAAMVGVAAVGEDDDGNAASAPGEPSAEPARNPYGTKIALKKKFAEITAGLNEAKTLPELQAAWTRFMPDILAMQKQDATFFHDLERTKNDRKSLILDGEALDDGFEHAVGKDD